MHAHIPNSGAHTQLQVLAACIDRAIGEVDEGLATLLPAAERVQLAWHLGALRLLWQTFEVLAGNLEQAGIEAIRTIARMEADMEITDVAAEELMRSFEQVLGEMYVNATAAQPA